MGMELRVCFKLLSGPHRPPRGGKYGCYFLLSPGAFGEEEILDVLLQLFDPIKVFLRRKLWMFFVQVVYS